MEQDAERIQLYSMTVHVCDFFGNAKPFPISRTWSDKVNEEFSHQYNEEIKRNVPATPYYKDLDINEVRYKNEFNFNKFIIQPLWQVFNKTLNDGIEECVKNVEDNVNQWEKLLNEVLISQKIEVGKDVLPTNIKEENEEEETDSSNGSQSENEEEKQKEENLNNDDSNLKEKTEVLEEKKDGDQ